MAKQKVKFKLFNFKIDFLNALNEVPSSILEVEQVELCAITTVQNSTKNKVDCIILINIVKINKNK